MADFGNGYNTDLYTSRILADKPNLRVFAYREYGISKLKLVYYPVHVETT